MEWREIVGVVGKVAATVAPVLGGPIGIAATVGAQIAGAIGTDNSPQAVMKELQRNPEAAAKLREWAHQEREQIRQYNARLIELDLQREEQRLKNVEHARETHQEKDTPAILTGALFVLVAVLSIALFFIAPPTGSKDLIVYVIGQIIGYLGVAVTFWLGSSLGSKRKDNKAAGTKP